MRAPWRWSSGPTRPIPGTWSPSARSRTPIVAAASSSRWSPCCGASSRRRRRARNRAGLKIELARLLLQRGETEEARGLLEPLAAGGRSGPGYADALELLVPLLQGADDALARSTVLAARSEMVQGSQRARLLYEAALAAQQAGDEARSARLARASVATEASQDALLLLAGLMRDASELAKAAASLTQAAQLAPPSTVRSCCSRPRRRGRAREIRPRRRSCSTASPASTRRRWDPAPGRRASSGWGPARRRSSMGTSRSSPTARSRRRWEIAEALEDAPRIRQSLWGLAQGPAGGEALARLGTLLVAEGTAAERQACAEFAETRRARDIAVALHRAILLSPPGEAGDEERLHALQRLQALGELDAVLAETLERVEASTPRALVEVLLRQVRGRRGAERERGLRLLATRVPSRAAELWQTLFEQARDDNRLEDAASALSAWVDATPDPVQRAGLRVQAGDLALAIGWTDAARAAWAQAAAEDPTSLAATSKLLALTSVEEAPSEFVDLAERLSSLAGPEALAGRQDELVYAYVRLGRAADALGVLSQLPPTEERVRQRADWPRRSVVRRRRSRCVSSSARTPEERSRWRWPLLRAGRHSDVVRILGPARLAGAALARVAAHLRHRPVGHRGGCAARRCSSGRCFSPATRWTPRAGSCTPRRSTTPAVRTPAPARRRSATCSPERRRSPRRYRCRPSPGARSAPR